MGGDVSRLGSVTIFPMFTAVVLAGRLFAIHGLQPSAMSAVLALACVAIFGELCVEGVTFAASGLTVTAWLLESVVVTSSSS